MDIGHGYEMSGGRDLGAAVRCGLAGASSIPSDVREHRRPHRSVFLDTRARSRRERGPAGAGTYQAGLLGEEAVADGLRRLGWRILGHRVRTRVGEIDLIARRASTVVFVEVKTAGPGRIDAIAAIDTRSRQRIRRAAVTWMSTHAREQRGVRHYRFDVYVVHRDRSGTIDHIDHVSDAF